MTPDRPDPAEEKGYARTTALVVMLLLVTVLLYQVIDGVQRRAYQRRRELRMREWREWRDRNWERELQAAAAAAATQPFPAGAVDHPRAAGTPAVPAR